MHAATSTLLDQVIDGLDAAALSALVEQVEAPNENFECLCLHDLPSQRDCSVGTSPSTQSLAELGRALLSGDESAPLLKSPDIADGSTQMALDVAAHALLVFTAGGLHVVAVSLGERGSFARITQLRKELSERIVNQDLAAAVRDMPGVSAAWALDAQSAAIVSSHAHATGRIRKGDLRDLENNGQLAALFASLVLVDPVARVAARQILEGALLTNRTGYCEVRRVPFVPRMLVSMQAASIYAGSRPWAVADGVAYDVLRGLLGHVLAADLKTQIEPFPKSDVEFEAILEEIRALEPDDLIARLVVGGFADHPVDSDESNMRCQECIYFLPHRRWCDLPELPVPVEADWYCRLWKM